MPTVTRTTELRYIDRGGTFNTAFTLPDDASWDPSATVIPIRIMNLDVSNLKQATVEDESLVQRLHHKRPPHVTTTRGTFSFSTYVGRSLGTTASNPIAILVGQAIGENLPPDTASWTLLGTHDINTYQATGIEGEVGGGEGHGKLMLLNNEMRATLSTATDTINVSMDMTAIPVDAQVVYPATMAYMDDDTPVNYFDFTLIGGDGDPDTVQMIGCSLESLALSSTGTEEVLQFDYVWRVADWRIPTANFDIMSLTAEAGGNPPTNHQAKVFLGNPASGAAATNAEVCATDISFGGDFVNFIDKQCRGTGTVNGTGGAIKGPAYPEITLTLYSDDSSEPIDDLLADFQAQTTKVLTVQFGDQIQSAGGTFCAHMAGCHITDFSFTTVNELRACTVTFQGTFYDGGSGNQGLATDIMNSPIVFGWA